MRNCGKILDYKYCVKLHAHERLMVLVSFFTEGNVHLTIENSSANTTDALNKEVLCVISFRKKYTAILSVISTVEISLHCFK